MGQEKDKFDILKFYGQQITEAVTTNPLLYFSLIDNYLCSGANGTDKGQCSCRQSCINRGSCCIDYFWNDRKTWFSIDEYVKYFLSKQADDLSCQKIANIEEFKSSKNSSTLKIDHVRMLTGCPKWNKLRLSTDFHPVVDPSDNVVYMNPTIAECYGAQQFSPISIEVGCDQTPMTENPQQQQQDGGIDSLPKFDTTCQYRAMQNNLPYCTPFKCNSETSGNSSKKEDAAGNHFRNTELCKKYGGLILINGLEFDNFHCSKCAHLPEPYKVNIPIATIGPRGMPMPHSVTLNYGQSGASALYEDTTKGDKTIINYNCPHHELFDVTRSQCLPFLCGPGYKRKGATCTKEQNRQSLDKLRKRQRFIDDMISCTLSSHSYANVYLNVSTQDGDDEFVYPNAKLLHQIKNSDVKATYNFYSVQIKTAEDIQKLKDQIKKNRTYILSGNLLFTTYSPHTKSKLLGITLNKGFPSARMCQHPVEFKNESLMTVTTKCSLNTSQVEIPRDSYLVQMEMSLLRNEITYTIYRCNEFYLDSNCPRIEIPLTDYEYNKNNGTLRIKETSNNNKNQYLIFNNASSYIPTETGISLCIDNYITEQSGADNNNKPEWVRHAEVAQSYLTMVGCLVSVVCYIFTIVVYTRAKELHTISGWNIIGICASLLVADVLILLTTAVDETGTATTLCSVIAYLLHYTLLSAQLWTAIISFEIMMTLRHGNSHRSINFYRTFIWYCTVVYGVPFITIFATSILDSTKLVNIGYGGNGICWISDQYYRIFLYLVPVVCISLFDIAVVISVVLHIYLHRKRTDQLLNKTSVVNSKEATILRTFLKLIFLMGLVELIGFVQLPVNLETWKAAVHVTVQFMYVVVRAFRGLFVWALYVYLNERAWKYKACRQSGHYSPKGSPDTTLTRRSNVNISLSKKPSFKITQTLNDIEHVTNV